MAGGYLAPGGTWVPQTASKKPGYSMLGDSLLGPTSGVINKGATGLGASLLSQAAEVTKKTPFKNILTGPGISQGGVVLGSGVRKTPLISAEDLVQSAILDRAQGLEAQARQRKQENQAQAQYEQGVQKVVGGARERAGELGSAVMGRMQPYQEANAANLDEIRQTARYLPVQAQQLSEQNTQAAEALKQATRDEYQDSTAASMQEARIGVMSNLDNQRQQLIAAASQQGLNASDPTVQAQIKQLEAGASIELGRMAAQTFTHYNDSVASMNQYYDSMITNVRQQGATGEMGASVNKLSGLVQAQRLEQDVNAFYESSIQATERLQTQIQMQADQWELQGYGDVANMMRDKTIAYSPIAPIVAMAFTLGEGEATTSGASLLPGVNQQGVLGSDFRNGIMGGGGGGDVSGALTSAPAAKPKQAAKAAKQGGGDDFASSFNVMNSQQGSSGGQQDFPFNTVDRPNYLGRLA